MKIYSIYIYKIKENKEKASSQLDSDTVELNVVHRTI